MDWARDDLPDYLWPALVMAEFGNDSARRFAKWQADVQTDLADIDDTQFLSECLDGRLSNLQRLGDKWPEATAAVRERAIANGLLSPRVQSALSSYAFRPAEWLVAADPHVPSQDDIDFLADAVLGALEDEHRQALIKVLFVWTSVQAGTFRTSQGTIDLLAPYPNNPGTLSAADTAIRAMWGAHKGAQIQESPTFFEPAIRWARVFWGANSMTSKCIRAESIETQETSEFDSANLNLAATYSEDALQDAPPVPPASVQPEGAHLRGLALDLLQSFAEAMEASPVSLYEPEAQEVLTGLVFRIGREVVAALASADLWSVEHGSHITRGLAECRIHIEWMALQDRSIYRTYKDYGAGKAKLYAAILEELPEAARTPEFTTAVERIRKLSHNDSPIDHRVVDTRDSFSGKSIRAMAEEAGLLDYYRQIYYMASGVAHSEFWAVELHSMERCMNILHRGHLIPSMSLSSGGSVEIASAWVDQLYTLIRLSMRSSGADERAITDAFDWLESNDPPV